MAVDTRPGDLLSIANDIEDGHTAAAARLRAIASSIQSEATELRLLRRHAAAEARRASKGAKGGAVYTHPPHGGTEEPPECLAHVERQHRDGKPPWCNNCGWTHGAPAVPPRKLGEPRS